MSAMDPNEIPVEFKDGVTAAILGGLGMVARLLLSTTPVSPGWVVRRVLAAGIASAIAGYALTDVIHSPGLRMSCVGMIGYCSPEGLDFLILWFKKRAEKEVGKAGGKKHGKTKPAATRGK